MTNTVKLAKISPKMTQLLSLSLTFGNVHGVAIHAPSSGRRAMRKAFVETTAENIWRTSRGLAPFAKNGEPLKPVAIQAQTGELTIQAGDIAVDPRVIPPNSDVLLIIQVGDRRE